MVATGTPFLSEKFTFAFSINVDWFQPFKHVSDSIGVIYLSILNLPRTERYKPENIIVCGVIPVPVEPKETINSYLYPLVQERLELWEGVQLNIAAHGQAVVRAALICLTSDIPATRKVCGLAGHAASMRCSKCLKRFLLLNKLDYSGYDRTHWNSRTIEEHRVQSTEFLAAGTKARQRAASNNKLCHNFSRLTIVHHFYYNRIVRLWNAIPTIDISQSYTSIKN